MCRLAQVTHALRQVVIVGCTFALASAAAGAAPNPRVSVAAAANLVHALEPLHAAFKAAAPGIDLTITVGASGSLFAQIRHGAPFDVFLSADADYPARLVRDRLGDPSTLRTYAVGRLALWTMRADLELGEIPRALRDPRIRKLAIAQPQTAPYGLAARAVMEHLGVLAPLERKLVVGESIAQTAQFVETNNADLGFVAFSLLQSPRLAGKGHWVKIPPQWHARVPLDHAAVLTRRGAANPAARRYLEFLGSPAAQEVLRAAGYHVE